MAEYIDREAIRYEQEIRYTATYDLTELPVAYSGVPVAIVRKSVIDAMPAADVAPVVHGRWERRRNCWYCTRCGKGYKIVCGAVAASTHAFCPNCGARMDGDSDAAD